MGRLCFRRFRERTNESKARSPALMQLTVVALLPKKSNSASPRSPVPLSTFLRAGGNCNSSADRARGPGANSEFQTIENGHVTWQVATRSAPPSIATFVVTFGYGGPTGCLIFA